MHVLIMYCSLFRQQIHLIAMKTEIATDVQLILMLNIAKIWDSREVWFISMNDHVFQPYLSLFKAVSVGWRNIKKVILCATRVLPTIVTDRFHFFLVSGCTFLFTRNKSLRR